MFSHNFKTGGSVALTPYSDRYELSWEDGGPNEWREVYTLEELPAALTRAALLVQAGDEPEAFGTMFTHPNRDEFVGYVGEFMSQELQP